MRGLTAFFAIKLYYITASKYLARHLAKLFDNEQLPTHATSTNVSTENFITSTSCIWFYSSGFNVLHISNAKEKSRFFW